MLNNLLGVIFVLCYATILSKIKFESEKKKYFLNIWREKYHFFRLNRLQANFYE